MSTLLPIIITDNGIASAITQDGLGLQLAITEVAFGDGDWSPDASVSALANEIKRFTEFGATVLAPGRIHITLRDNSNDIYDLREIGFYDENGDLFGIYSQSAPIVTKTVDGKILITATIPLTSVPPASVTIAGNEFDYNPATEELMGVAKIATQEKVDAGSDDESIVTPRKLKNWVKQATESFFGLIKVASKSQTDTGTNDSVAITPKKLRWGISLGSNHLVLPSWLGSYILQWGTTTLSGVGSYNSRAIGGTNIYTNYYSISYPIAFTEQTLFSLISLASSTFESQRPMGGESATSNLNGNGNSLLRFDAAISSPEVGFTPTVHWFVIGK